MALEECKLAWELEEKSVGKREGYLLEYFAGLKNQNQGHANRIPD